MRLNFNLLVVDDDPTTINQSIISLKDHLAGKGFVLNTQIANDLSPSGLRKLARQEGRNFDLVAIDYHLSRDDTNGAKQAAAMRTLLGFTDILFYSSKPNVNLYDELAREKVTSVFIGERNDLGRSLRGLADTVIGKVVDVSHMRGIAMAEVADMDVMMEDILLKVFSSGDAKMASKATRTMNKLIAGAEESLAELKKIVESGLILDLVSNPAYFTSMQRYKGIQRVLGCLENVPLAASPLADFVDDVIHNRNALAHAKGSEAPDGSISLRSIRRGHADVVITEQWMTDFRTKLLKQKLALTEACLALHAYVEGVATQQAK
ncbi:hypothetical protein MMA231_01252 [Asticcacaulis sp. MM231]|uniref:hypothetical protein n=1 Tax=Asticcacaulis sp. MM231 TaxID=3157666 RepID=UPI0032D5A999